MAKIDSILSNLGGESRIDLGLARFQSALREAGNPEKNVKTIVIGGTNGKGTTTLFISHALKQQGYRVGTYLSPHLHHIRERILCDLEPIDEPELESLASAYAKLAGQHQLTYFEFLTLLYFVWAKARQLNFSVLEVGLGGRLDATNVTEPLACVVTNIGLDHQKFLGQTHASILSEKLDILRTGAPLFTGIYDTCLQDQCLKEAETIGCPVHFSLSHSLINRDWTGQTVRIDGHDFFLNNPTTGALESATLAYDVIRKVFPDISLSAIRAGFSECKTPGRFELVGDNPRILLSGDHNLEGLECLFETLDSLPPVKLHTLCAFSLDKPYAEMYRRLLERSESIQLTTFEKNPTPLPADYLGMGKFTTDPVQALADIMARAHPSDIVLVTGSLYLVGAVRASLLSEIAFY